MVFCNNLEKLNCAMSRKVVFSLQLRHSYQIYDKTRDKRQANNPPFRIALSYDASVEEYVYYITCITYLY